MAITPEQKKKNIATWRGKFPEKYKAIAKCRKLPRSTDCELHHWSYNEEHWQDIIHLTIKEHKVAHRFIIYDQERMMYRIATTGELLDTRERHLDFIYSVQSLSI